MSVLLLLATIVQVFALWPRPSTIRSGDGAIRLSSHFSVETTFDPPPDLQAAIERTKLHISSDSHHRLTPSRGSDDVFDFNLTTCSTISKLKLVLSPSHFSSPIRSTQQVFNLNQSRSFVGLSNAETEVSSRSQLKSSISEETNQRLEDWKERYTLIIPSPTNGDGDKASGEAILEANSALGFLRGLETFSQAVYTTMMTSTVEGGSEGEVRYIVNVPLTIVDEPKFPYRGLLIDTSRNFYPIDVLKRQIDAMSWAKLNVFHWHIVDSTSFPLSLDTPPYDQLSEKTSYSKSQTYNETDFTSLLNYAAERGITTIVEIDSPGHMTPLGKTFEELGACIERSPWQRYSAEPPSGQVRLDENGVRFVKGLFEKVTKLIPGAYFSTGGDEIDSNCYLEDESTLQLLKIQNWTLEDALTNFVVETHSALLKHNKIPAVWDEIVLNHQVGKTHKISNDSLVFVWRNSKFVKDVVNVNYKIVHAAADYFYLDCGGGGWIGDCPGCNSWCDPYKTWQRIYTFDPYENVGDNKHLIMGGQTLLWSEQSGPENVDPAIWPRAASAGELWWSGNGDVAEALPRLNDWSYRARKRGLNTIRLQSEWCAYNPGKCDLKA